MSSLFNVIKQNYSDNAMMMKELNRYYEELQDLRSRKYKKLLEMEYQLGYLGKPYEDLKNLEDNYKEQMLMKAAVKHNNLYVWVTINPKPDVTFDNFRKKVEKLVKRQMFSNYLYVYEQRGTTEGEMGKGFHAHILATRKLKYKPNKVARNIKNTCKGLVGDVNKSSQLNIQFIGDEYMNDKKTYILGKNKTGEGKDVKQDIDVVWRKKNNLNNYYKCPEEESQKAAHLKDCQSPSKKE